jgi:hypothetical protein
VFDVVHPGKTLREGAGSIQRGKNSIVSQLAEARVDFTKFLVQFGDRARFVRGKNRRLRPSFRPLLPGFPFHATALGAVQKEAELDRPIQH